MMIFEDVNFLVFNEFFPVTIFKINFCVCACQTGGGKDVTVSNDTVATIFI